MAVILVIDDREPDRRFLTTLLGYARHTTYAAEDGLTALDLVERLRPDLVITDIVMPGIDGFELARRLRATPAVADTPVIFYTATYREREARELAAQVGIAEVITKPSEPDVLLATIEAVLQKTTPGRPRQQAVDASEFEREHSRITNEKLLQKVADLERSESRMASLLDTSLQLATERDPGVLLKQLCDAVRGMTGSRVAAIGIVSEDLQRNERVVISGLSPAEAAHIRDTLSVNDWMLQVVRDREVVRVTNPSGRPEDLGLPSSYPHVSSFLLVPLASPGRVHGWFSLVDKVNGTVFSHEDERIALTLGVQAGIAYENAKLISELREHAQRLQENDERTNYAMRAARCGIWDMDLETRSMTMTPAMAALLGIGDGEAVQTSEERLSHIHPEDRDAVFHARETAIRDRSNLSVDFRYVMPDGHTRWHRSIGRVVSAAGGPPRLIGVTIDITERRLLEQQLRQAQKMEAVGQLAGGVAHDFNNLLTAILGYARFMLDDITDPALNADVEEIVKAAERAAALTKQLLAFSRRQVIQTTLIDLNGLIDDMATMLRRLIGEHIVLDTSVTRDLARVRADRSHIEQVIMNLVVNAGDAMPRGGRILLETGNVELDATHRFRGAAARPGQYVMLAVTDTGEGMTEETKARLFEPFFTTKGQGKGTGLGLATVYGIVTQAGGHIWVYSELGRGTTFKVYLPQGEARQAPQEVRAHRPKPVGGSETVLLVEDEELVRGLIKTILGRAGYQVIEASSPAQAIEHFGALQGNIDLLVTDVVMPGGLGPDLHRTLAQARPNLRVLFMSGYTDTAVIDLAVLEKEAGFIQKPFTSEGLTRKVREVLDR